MKELDSQYGEKKERTIEQEQHPTFQLAAALDDIDGDSDLALSLEDEMKRVINHDAKNEDCILCCCHPDLEHDEGIKFSIKSDDPKALDWKLFQDRSAGGLVDLDESNAHNLKIPTKIDKKMIYGRNLDIYKGIQFLNNQDSYQRILIFNGKDGSGYDQIAKFTVKYVVDRHIFYSGAFYIDTSDKFSQQGIITAISKQMLLPYKNAEELVQGIKRYKLILMMNNISDILKKDGDNFRNFLYLLMNQTDKLKVVLMTEEEDDILQKDHQINQFVEQINISSLDKTDSIKLMHKINYDNQSFMKQYPKWQDIKKDLEQQKIYDSFQLTPRQIIQISMLLQDGRQLIGSIKMVCEESSRNPPNQLKDNQLRDQKLNKLIHKKILETYQLEINVIYLLSLATYGLTQYDLIKIISEKDTNIKKDQGYGDWKNFLVKMVIKRQKNCEIDQNGYLKIAQNDKNYSSIFEQVGDDSQSNMDSVASKQKSQKSKWSLGSIQYRSDYYVLIKEKLEDIDQEKFLLQKSFRKFILKAQDEKLYIYYTKKYLKYMSTLSRKLITSIMYWKVLEFDPYIVSASIGEGMWSPPESIRFEMHLQDQQNENIDKAIDYFWVHEGNFQEILDNQHLGELLGKEQLKDEDKKDILIYIEEMCINIPTILLLLERYKETKEWIDKLEVICMNFDLDLTQPKLLLIEISLLLDINNYYDIDKKINEVQNQFDEKEHKEGHGEASFLKAIYHINMISKEKEELNPKSNNEDDSLAPSRFNSNQISQSGENTIKISEDSYAHCSSTIKTTKYKKLLMQTSRQRSNNLKQLYDNAIEELKVARKNYGSLQRQIAKTWLIQADLILDKVQGIDEITNLIEKDKRSIYEELNRNLEEAADYFFNNDIVGHYFKCLLHIAKIEYELGDYIKSQEKIIECLTLSRQLNLSKIQIQAQKLLQEISAKIRIEYNKVFIFAKSLPINKIDDMLHDVRDHAVRDAHRTTFNNYVMHKQIQDDRQTIKNTLYQTNKELIVKFDIITKRFLQNIVEFGAKILHLSPRLYNIENNNQQIVIEDENFNRINLTLKELKKILGYKGQPLNISVVIIELPNCQKFCEVFKQLGVAHVISFKNHISRASFKVHEDYQMDTQFKINLVTDFMKEFSLHLYPQLLSDQSIEQAIENAEKLTNQKSLAPKYLKITVTHISSSKRQREKLYDKQDERNLIKDGTICDISQIRAPTNLKIQQHMGPYVVGDDNNFGKLVNHLFDDAQQTLRSQDNPKNAMSIQSFEQNMNRSGSQSSYSEVNVYGGRGVGKTRLVQEVADYLRFRYLFGAGIYRIDLSNSRDSRSVANDIIELIEDYQNLNTPPQENNKTIKSSNQTLSQLEMMRNSMSTGKKFLQNDLLIIFDNCDKFVNENRASFEMNIQYLKEKVKNICIIMISEQKLDDEFKIKSFKIKPLQLRESLIFLQSTDPNQQLYLRKIQISRQSTPRTPRYNVDQDEIFADLMKHILIKINGNIQLLNIISMIFKYGGEQLLKKIKILDVSQLSYPRIKTFVSQSPNDEELELLSKLQQTQTYIHTKPNNGFTHISQDLHSDNHYQGGLSFQLRRAGVKAGQTNIKNFFQSSKTFKTKQYNSKTIVDSRVFGIAQQHLNVQTQQPNLPSKNQALNKLLEEALNESPRNVRDLDQRTGGDDRDIFEEDVEVDDRFQSFKNSLKSSNVSQLLARDHSPKSGGIDNQDPFDPYAQQAPKMELFKTIQKSKGLNFGRSLIKSICLEKISESGGENSPGKLGTQSIENRISEDPYKTFTYDDNISYFVPTQKALITEYHGFKLQAYNNDNKELKIIVNQQTQQMEILIPQPNNKQKQDFTSASKLSNNVQNAQKRKDKSFQKKSNQMLECFQQHDIDCVDYIDDDPKSPMAENGQFMTQLKESQKLSIKEFIIYVPFKISSNHTSYSNYPFNIKQPKNNNDKIGLQEIVHNQADFWNAGRDGDQEQIQLQFQRSQSGQFYQLKKAQTAKENYFGKQNKQIEQEQLKRTKSLVESTVNEILSQNQSKSRDDPQDGQSVQNFFNISHPQDHETIKKTQELFWEVIKSKVTLDQDQQRINTINQSNVPNDIFNQLSAARKFKSEDHKYHNQTSPNKNDSKQKKQSQFKEKDQMAGEVEESENDKIAEVEEFTQRDDLDDDDERDEEEERSDL